MEGGEEIEAIWKSQLSAEEKNMLIDAYCNAHTTSSPLHQHDKIHVREANSKEEKDDVMSERKHESSSCSSSEQSKAKGGLDTIVIDEISSILKSELSREDITAAFTVILLDKAAASSQKLHQQQETKSDSDEKRDGDKFLINDGTSKMIEESSSFLSPQQQEKGNVAAPGPGSEQNLEEKSAPNGNENENGNENGNGNGNGNANGIPPSEEDTSSSSSNVEVQEIDKLTDAKASTQVAPSESCRFLLDNEVFIVKESDNSQGKENEIIHKQEAVCKLCHKLLSPESNVLKAKCGCTSPLIHQECANIWSQEKGNKCFHCQQQIQNTAAKISLPLQTNQQVSQPQTSTPKRYWCCFC